MVEPNFTRTQIKSNAIVAAGSIAEYDGMRGRVCKAVATLFINTVSGFRRGRSRRVVDPKDEKSQKPLPDGTQCRGLMEITPMAASPPIRSAATPATQALFIKLPVSKVGLHTSLVASVSACIKRWL